MARIAKILLLGFVLIALADQPSIVTAAKPVNGSWSDELNSYDTSRWFKADGWSNGFPFDVGWRADHIQFATGLMTLTLDNVPCPGGCSGKRYASGEYRTLKTYGYGLFEVRMKAASGSGLVTSFFTYTGPTERPPRPWDEIDIEILGNDPTRLHVNYVSSGLGGHETVIELGFDASFDFHTYAFEWTKDKIVWFVDGRPIHTEDGSRGPLPSNPGKIMMNLWAGRGAESWMGAFTYTAPVHAVYDRVTYAPSGLRR